MTATGDGGTAAAVTFPASFSSSLYPTPSETNLPDTMVTFVFEESEPFEHTRNSGEVQVGIPANYFWNSNSVCV
ncbi:hypothetical protein Hdeb2414_s0070g00773031 [Helianthus debilis subsp. tardiflorus]